MAPQEQHYKFPECYNALTVEIAVGGKVPGSSYIRCNNLPQHPSGQRYFYRLSSGNSSLATSSKSSKQSETAWIAEEGWRLDLTLGLRSPSPDLPLEVMLHHQDALQEEEDLALALCLSEEDITTSALSISTLRVLSPSPELPTSIASSATAPALSQALTPDATGGPLAPRKHLPALSTHLSHFAPLHITTQMNDVWMSSNSGPELQSRAQTNVPTFHIRQTSTRRPFTDPHLIKRFMVVFYSMDDKPHTVSFIEDCPSWSTWRVSEATGNLAYLVADDTTFELFSDNFKAWIEVIICNSSSDEDDSGAQTRTKASKHVIHIDDNSVLRSLSPLPSTPSLPSSLRASPPLEVLSPAAAPRPTGMYTMDMVTGFIQMKSDELKHIVSWSDRFMIVFGQGYKSLTYNNHVRKWREAPAAPHTQALDGGRTSEGSWSMFVRRVEHSAM
ncbi:hypothetical protein B0H17DRAFT_1128596 [Mycena rosella]|uniref:Uncharacterized protein n=1 Tax=Mycena rosella TaxID=1033263 RepID=A0AAD7DXR2_MYCRO|nr:hypothetical protein B0H17DRAFT_1128596 [Mycena rosella]